MGGGKTLTHISRSSGQLRDAQVFFTSTLE
jgi:hypothetical protein